MIHCFFFFMTLVLLSLLSAVGKQVKLLSPKAGVHVSIQAARCPTANVRGQLTGYFKFTANSN